MADPGRQRIATGAEVGALAPKIPGSVLLGVLALLRDGRPGP